MLLTTAPAVPWGTPPFDAWVQADSVVVIPSSTRQWPSLGIVGLGDTVRVVSCEPSCTDTGGWANLAPFGAIRLRKTKRGKFSRLFKKLFGAIDRRIGAGRKDDASHLD